MCVKFCVSTRCFKLKEYLFEVANGSICTALSYILFKEKILIVLPKPEDIFVVSN